LDFQDGWLTAASSALHFLGDLKIKIGHECSQLSGLTSAANEAANLEAQNYSAINPPSTARDAPMMYEALSEPTNTMACAISSGVPLLPP
jgi:hypothetical protein